MASPLTAYRFLSPYQYPLPPVPWCSFNSPCVIKKNTTYFACIYPKQSLNQWHLTSHNKFVFAFFSIPRGDSKHDFPWRASENRSCINIQWCLQKKESEIISEQSMVNQNKVGNCLNNMLPLESGKLKSTGLINRPFTDTAAILN